MTGQAELLLRGGKIVTLDPTSPVTTALAIKDGRVAALGASALAMRGPRTRQLPLDGGLALPGFVDAHIHLLWFGLGLEHVDLAAVTSLGEVERRISRQLQRVAPGSWVTGGGWNHDLWSGFQPGRNFLDRLSTQHPMLFSRKDGHSIWVNSTALAAADIDRETPDPPGGRIDRDSSGAPTGILAEEAMALVRRLIPAPDDATVDRATRAATTLANRAGITGIHDMEGPEARAAFGRQLERGELKLRVQMMVDLASWRQGWPDQQTTNSGDALLQTGSLKIFADGALGSRTAAMLAPYDGSDRNLGVVVTGETELRRLIAGAAQQRVACAIHAIGDAANRMVLDAFAATRSDWAPRSLRQRIEHVQLLHPDDLPRLSELGIVASMQPAHATADMEIADRFWGPRCRLAYAWRSILDSGATLSFGSDCPVEPLDVLAGLYAAVTRCRASGEPDGGWYSEQRLTLEEAVHAYTSGAAFSAGREHDLGTLTPGKWADITILDTDIFSSPPDALLTANVQATIVAGRVVYNRAAGE